MQLGVHFDHFIYLFIDTYAYSFSVTGVPAVYG